MFFEICSVFVAFFTCSKTQVFDSFTQFKIHRQSSRDDQPLLIHIYFCYLNTLESLSFFNSLYKFRSKPLCVFKRSRGQEAANRCSFFVASKIFDISLMLKVSRLNIFFGRDLFAHFLILFSISNTNLMNISGGKYSYVKIRRWVG